ncbi:hypothetical protein FRB97_008051 [Tulasnella sp. 331]|nr:hypothetical protein FRB97_008051 [Tulasnella sp. 331]
MLTNRGDCEELHDRAFSLTLVVLASLQGTSEEDLNKNNLKANMEQLAETRTYSLILARHLQTYAKKKLIAVTSECANLLSQLLQPADARFDSGPRESASSCLQGTRVAVLEELQRWIYNRGPDQPCLFWLYGVAGTGKTTLNKLVIESLQGVVDAPIPLVIVLDALDECVGSSSAADILLLPADMVPKLPAPLCVRILIASRSEHHIQTKFASSAVENLSRSMALHGIQGDVVHADIELYLRNRLQDIETEEEVNRLKLMAKGLFVYASTASDFIRDVHYSNLQRQLRVLLSGDDASRSSAFYSLDQLYIGVLASSLPEARNPYLERRLRTVLGSAALLFDHLSPRSLDALLQEDPGTVTSALTLLEPFIVVPDGSDETNLLHVRVSMHRETFFHHSIAHHARLARHSLDHMLNSLKRDICDIQNPSKLNLEVEDLRTRLRRVISYSEVDGLAAGLRRFCHTKLLNWLEVLSLVQRLELAVPSLKMVEEWLEIISMSAARIYLSALPLTPHCDRYEVYQHELADSVAIRKGQEMS